MSLLTVRATAAVALGVLLLLLAPTPAAQAHAVLLRSDPSDGAVLALAPSAVRLVFNEPVDSTGAGLRVFAADGTRVDLARPPERADEPTPDPAVLTVALPEGLDDGGYVVAWRVRSADGHTVAGTLRFTVGEAQPVPDDVVAALADAEAPAWVRTMDRAVRGTILLGLLTAAGTAAATLAVVRTPAQRGTASRVIRRSAGATLALVPVGLWLQGAVQAGGTAWPTVTSTLAGAPALPAAVARAAGLVLLILAAGMDRASAPVRSVGRREVLLLPAAALALLPLAAEGHQRSGSSTGLAVLLPGLDAVHIAAGAIWVGAVLILAIAVSTRTDPAEAVGALAARVGRTAGVALVVVAVAGVAQAIPLLGGPGGLGGPASLASSDYGVTLAIKVALVAGAVAVAGIARRRARRTPGWQRARGLLRVELGLIGAALLVTGVLVTLPPPVDVEVDLFTTSAPLGDGLVLEVGVDGSRPGRTELHLYVVEDGALSGRPLDVRATMTSIPEGIGPFRVAPLLVEPGHWFAALEPLPAGDWSLDVTVGLDRFTERTTTFRVPLP
jgi:copper transport protein